MRLKLSILFVLAILIGTGAFADNSTGAGEAERVLAGASLYGNTPNISMRIAMLISGPRGDKQRVLEAFIKRDGRAARIFIHVVSPGFLANMKFLTHRAEDGSESQWLSTSRGVRKLAGGGAANERLFDSDFSVEDLSEIDSGTFHLSLLADQAVDELTAARSRPFPSPPAQTTRRRSSSLKRADRFCRESTTTARPARSSESSGLRRPKRSGESSSQPVPDGRFGRGRIYRAALRTDRHSEQHTRPPLQRGQPLMFGVAAGTAPFTSLGRYLSSPPPLRSRGPVRRARRRSRRRHWRGRGCHPSGDDQQLLAPRLPERLAGRVPSLAQRHLREP